MLIIESGIEPGSRGNFEMKFQLGRSIGGRALAHCRSGLPGDWSGGAGGFWKKQIRAYFDGISFRVNTWICVGSI